VGGRAGRGKNQFKVQNLFADEQCTRPSLDFLRTTEVGRGVEPGGEREEAQIQDSEGGTEEEREDEDEPGEREE